MTAVYIAIAAVLITIGIVAVVTINLDERDVWQDTEWERYEED